MAEYLDTRAAATAANAPLAAPNWAPAAEQWFKAYRTTFDTLLALTNAALAGAERMRMAQLEADVATQTENRGSALAAADCGDINALFAVQSQLAQAYTSGALKYWATIAEAAQQTNQEMVRILTARAADFGALAALPGMVPAQPSAAMRQPFLAAFEAARASQEAIMRSFAAFATPDKPAEKGAAKAPLKATKAAA